MELTKVEIKSFRSFADTTSLSLLRGMNSLVGPNNCGKSNFFRALRMALDEAYQFDPRLDVPIQRPTASPKVILTFHCRRVTQKEKTLLHTLEAYEKSVLPVKGPTYAEQGVIRLIVTYKIGRNGMAVRHEYFAVRGAEDRTGDADLNEKALEQLRKVIRFVAIASGENIEQVLAGEFRKILTGTLQSELETQFQAADRAREDYIAAIQRSLLAPMKTRIFSITRRLFPELAGVSLVPAVEPLEATLAKVTISLRDSIETELSQKGTGLAGGVLIALLRYLTEANRESLLFAIEEPETFLHPAAQESLRDDLEALAEDTEVSLLVTTHSPFILSRSRHAQVIAIEKDPKGVSKIAATAPGNENQSELISGLFRDNVLPALFDRYNSVPKGARALLLVEGASDKAFIDIAIEKLGYADKLNGLHVLPNTGVDSLVMQAVLLRSEASQEVWALTDSDIPGRKARDILVDRFKFRKQDLFEYRQYVGGNLQDAEAEWMFPQELMKKFVQEYGPENVLKAQVRHGDEFRFDFTSAGKDQFPEWLRWNSKPEDFGQWRVLLDDLSEKLSNSLI